RGDAQDPAHGAVAFSASGFAFDAGRFVVSAGDCEPGGEVAGGGEGAHVVSEFGGDDLCAGGVDAGDGGEVGQVLVLVGVIEQVRDALVEGADLVGVVVDLFEVVGHEVAVVVGEVSGERFGELFAAGFDVAVGQLRERRGLAGAFDQGVEDGASARADQVADDAGDFDPGVLQGLFQ